MRSTPLLLLVLLLVGCSTPSVSESPTVERDEREEEVTEEEKEVDLLEETALGVMESLSTRDLIALADYTHPVFGVRFTPHTFVQTEETSVAAEVVPHTIIPAEYLPGMFEEDAALTWGIHPGSGRPISMTFTEYFDTYIYNHNYLDAPVKTWNEPLTRGSAIDNAREVYGDDAEIVEYHFPEFDKSFGGLDWESLRLVFKKDYGEWYLVGIIHDAWTP